MSGRASLGHLVRRALGSLRNTPVGADDLGVARSVLSPGEFEIWHQMTNRDKLHSLEVLGRFDASMPVAPVEARRAALLHDVGKIASDLNWPLRVVATIVGPRGRRFRAYHDHEALGVAMLQGISDEKTLMFLAGEGDSDLVRALLAADDV